MMLVGDDNDDDDDDDVKADLPPQERLLDRSLPVPRGTMAVGGFPGDHREGDYDGEDLYNRIELYVRG